MRISKILPIIMVLAVQSCTTFLDNRESIAKTEVEKQIGEQSKGDLQLTSFEKVDGKDVQNESYQYELEFKAKMAIKNDCMWLIGSPTLAAYGRPFSTMDGDRNNVKSGETVDFNGTVYFEKKESGWSVSRVELEPK